MTTLWTWPKNVHTWCLLLLWPTALFSQSPAGVPHPTFWFKNTLNAAAAHAATSIVGNHLIDSTEHFFAALEPYRTESSDGTWFWVLIPKFDSSSGVEFARFGDVVINDYGIRVEANGYHYPFVENTPILLHAHYGGSRAYRVRQNLLTAKADSSLFEVAEALFFDRILTDYDRRRVESYLGLKYSLNITINATGLWKDYLAAEGDSLWNSQTDTYFNQQVLGLGHDTVSHWYQVQTATNDTHKIRIAVDTLAFLGHQPRSALSPGSKAVFSLREKRQWGTQLPCDPHSGNPVIWEGWKFKVNHWGTVNTRFAVELDENLVNASVLKPMVVLSSDSGYVDYLPVTTTAGGYRFNIPLDSVEDHVNYYIAMVDSGAVCLSQVIFQTVDAISCGSTNAGGISAFVARELLPAQLTLTTSEQRYVHTIADPYVQINGLSKGVYDLHLANDNGLLALSTVQLGKDCPCAGHPEWNITQTPAERHTTAPRSITLYPNPVQANQTVYVKVNANEQPIEYLIYTRDGRLILQEETAEKRWHCSLPVSGAYVLQCKLESTTLSAQIIVQ